jgi:hypothetical protein
LEETSRPARSDSFTKAAYDETAMVVVQHGATIEYVKPQSSILPALQFLSLIHSPEASKLQHNALLRCSGCHSRYGDARLLKLKAMTRGSAKAW